MKILICDDEINYITDLKLHIEKYMSNRFIKYEIQTSMDPCEIISNNVSYDLAFLDIQMNGVSGISLGHELKRRNSKTVIFFVTSHNEYQDDAMDLRAFRFFEKPFNCERLYSGLDKAMEYIDEKYVDIFLYKDKRQVRIPVDDIIYVHIENRRTVITTVNGDFTAKENFERWCELLPQLFFYRVHKSFLVNLHYVDIYKYSELFLNGGVRIPIAPRKQSAFHKYWFKYLRRR